MDEECGTQEGFIQQLEELINNRKHYVNLTDFETACDRLLTVCFTNSKLSHRDLAKVIHICISIFPEAKIEKLYQKLVGQCAMSNVVLAVMADCGSDNTEQDMYSITISRDLPLLVDLGTCGFLAATTLIREMMVKNELSLETLLQALLLYKDHSILQLFVRGTIVKTLEEVDNNYIRFWKLLVNIKDRSLLPKLADKFPNFLLSLEMFITCCGDAMKVTVNENFELQWDCQEALMNNEQLMVVIKSVVNAGGISGTSIKETITKRQQRAIPEAELDHSSVWIELGKACFG